MKLRLSPGQRSGRAKLVACACACALAMGLLHVPRIAEPRTHASSVAGVSGLADELPTALAQAGPAASAGQRGFDEAIAYLPALNHEGEYDLCESWVNLQNLGSEPAQAVMAVLGNDPGCAPCAALRGVECTGLFRPGSAWALLGAQISTGAGSAVIFSLEAQADDDAGAGETASLPPASAVCADLHQARLEDRGCDALAELIAAWRPGGHALGMKSELLLGMPIAAAVHRSCHGPEPFIFASAGYAAPSALELGRAEEGLWRYDLAGVTLGDSRERSTLVAVQNAGARCATVRTALLREGSCEAGPLCPELRVAPGAAAYVDLAACAEDGYQGGLRIEGDQPLAVLAHSLQETAAGTHVAAPLLASAIEPDAQAARASQAEDRAFWVLPFDGSQVETTLWLGGLDLAGAAPSMWRLRVLRADATVVREEELVLCPGGPQRILLPAEGEGPIRVDLQRVEGSGRIHGVAMARDLGTEPDAVQRMLSLPLEPGPLPSEPGSLLALPLVAQDPWGSGLTTRIAISSLDPAAGPLQASLRLLDTNGLVDVLCVELPPGGTVMRELAASLPYQGFLGSALVSAEAWERGDAPGLGAAVALREERRAHGNGGVVFEHTSLSDVRALRLLAPAARDLPGWALAAPCALAPYPPRPVEPPAYSGELPAPDERARGSVISLPALGSQGQNFVCDVELAIENHGDLAARPALLYFAEPGFGAPSCRGPWAIDCLASLPPGGRTSLDLGSAGRSESYGGLAISLDDRSLAELGIELPGVPPTAAASDLLCAELEALVDDCAAYEGLRHALWSELPWRGLPLDRALGPDLTIRASRRCPEGEGGYLGLSDRGLVEPFASGGPYAYSVPQAVLTDQDEMGRRSRTRLHIQNAGARTATLSFWMRDAASCGVQELCNVGALAAGDTYELLYHCVDPPWIGSIVIRSAEPLAIVAERIPNGVPPDALRLQPARPAAQPFDLTLDARVDDLDRARIEADLGLRKGDPGWDDHLDLDADGQVTAEDLAWWDLHRCPKPPSTPVPATATPRPTEGPLTRRIHLPWVGRGVILEATCF